LPESWAPCANAGGERHILIAFLLAPFSQNCGKNTQAIIAASSVIKLQAISDKFQFMTRWGIIHPRHLKIFYSPYKR